MDEGQQILKNRFDELPPGLRRYISAKDWVTKISDIETKHNISDDSHIAFENEILLTLLCLEPIADLAENIKRELGIDSNMAEWVAEDVNREIFSQVSDDMGLMWQTGDRAESQEEVAAPENKNQVQNNIGESFEQIVLNQARAMQPARNALASEAGRPAIGASEEPKVIRPAERQLREAPENLPTRQGEGVGVPDYSLGQDPYREPLG